MTLSQQSQLGQYTAQNQQEPIKTIKYHAFYVYAIGCQARYQHFDTEEEVLDFFKHTVEDGYYRDLRIICGSLLEFEPHQVVESWRIKEPKDPA